MKPNPCASRFREKISFAVCEVLAAKQGLAVYRLPGSQSLQRRYAVGRADLWVQSPLIKYVGLQALWAALTVKGTK